jgi:hypothetical protein
MRLENFIRKTLRMCCEFQRGGPADEGVGVWVLQDGFKFPDEETIQ